MKNKSISNNKNVKECFKRRSDVILKKRFFNIMKKIADESHYIDKDIQKVIDENFMNLLA